MHPGLKGTTVSAVLALLFLQLTPDACQGQEIGPTCALAGADAKSMEGAGRVVRLGAGREGLRFGAGKAASRLVYTFTIPRQAAYRLWVRCRFSPGVRLTCTVAGQGPYDLAPPTAMEASWLSVAGTAWDLPAGPSQVEFASTGGAVTIERLLLTADFSLQPRNAGPRDAPEVSRQPIYLADSFQDEGLGTQTWTSLSGAWEVTKPVEHTDPTRASNAYTCVGRSADSPAVLVAGERLWRNYSIDTAAQTVGGSGTLGLVCNVQDPHNYHRARLHAGYGPGTSVLERVEDGKVTRLAATSGRLRPRQFYHLRLESWHGRLRVLVDGHLLLEADDPTFMNGKAGLLAESAHGIRYDDVLVRSVRRVEADVARTPAQRWHGASSFAARGTGFVVTGPAAPTTHGVRPGMRPRDIQLDYQAVWTGAAEWTGYTVSTRVSTPARTPAGPAVAGSEGGGGLALLRIPRQTNEAEVFVLRALGTDGATLCRWERPPTPSARHLSLSLYRGVATAAVDGAVLGEVYLGRETTGRAGLVATGGATVFEEVCVEFDQKPQPVLATNTIFRHDSYMTNWASPAGEWDIAEDKSAAWSLRDFYGNTAIGYDFERLPPPGAFQELYLYGDGTDRDSGYRLQLFRPPVTARQETTARDEVELSGEAGRPEIALRLFRQGEEVAAGRWNLQPHREAADVLAGSERHGLPVRARISLERCGNALVVRQDGADILVYHEGAPLPGLRCGVGAGRFDGAPVQDAQAPQVDVNRIVATSDQLFNDIFTTAAVHWRRSQGDWRMKNRFWCAPQWAWYGGRSKESAVLWHKRGYGGDFTFDVYMSMQMDRTGTPHYFRPGFMNITVCGDGRDLSSGYTFVYGLKDGTMSAMYRGAEQVLTNSEPEAQAPQVRDKWPDMKRLHRRWWHWRCEKRGPRLRYYLDGELLFDFADPEPLSGNRIALWTEHRGIMVSRARVAYTKRGKPEYPLLPNPAPALPAAEAADGPATQAGCAYAASFERGAGAWVHTGRENSARVTRERRADVGGTALVMRNELSGGDFGVLCQLPEGLDLLQAPWLRFDMRCSPNTYINWYFRVGEEWFSLRLNGHEDGIDSDIYPGAPREQGKGTRYIASLGEVSGFAADDRWHRYELNVGDCLLPWLDALPGARPGAARVDAFFIGNLDVADLAQSGMFHNRQGATYRLDNVEVFGTKTPAAALRIEPIGPVGLSGWARARLLDNPGAPWLDLTRLRHGGDTAAPLPAEAFASRPDEGTLEFDLPRLGVALRHGAASLVLSGVGRRGTDPTGEIELHWPAPQGVPAVPRVFAVRMPGQDLEPAAESFAVPPRRIAGAHTWSVWDRSSGANRGGCRRFISRLGGGTLETSDLVGQLDLRQYPVLAFLYRAEKGVRFDLALKVGGAPLGVGLLNQGQGLEANSGTVPAHDDMAWHQVHLDLGQRFCRTVDTAAGTEVKQIRLLDDGYTGSADGVNFWVDEVRCFPFVKPRADGTIPFELSVSALRPVAGIRYAVLPFGDPPPSLCDEDVAPPVVVAPPHAGTTRVSFVPPEAGTYTLHWAAQGAGGWGRAPLHHFAVDQAAPRLGRASPTAGQEAAPRYLSLLLEDEGQGICPGSVRLRLADQDLRPERGDPDTRYTPQNGAVRVDLAAHPRRVAGAFADDGEAIPVQLEATDLAGNRMVEAWTWTMVYAHDKTAPQAPRLRWVPAAAYVRTPNHLNGATHGLRADPQQGRFDVHADAERGRSVLRLRTPGGWGSGHITLCEEDLDLRQGLHLKLAWRIHGRWLADFRFHVDGSVYALRFQDNDLHGATSIGRLKPVKQGAWSTAWFDVATPLLEALPEGTPPVVSRVELGSPQGKRNHPHHWLLLDDLALCNNAQRTGGIEVRWTPVRDPSGVLYAVTADDNPKGRPNAGFTADRDHAVLRPIPAGRFVHVAARDRAGNTSFAHLEIQAAP